MSTDSVDPSLSHAAKLVDLGFSLGRAEQLTESQAVPHGTVQVFGSFVSEYAAKFAREAYLERWHPVGYGTTLTIGYTNGRYVVSGWRADSCE